MAIREQLEPRKVMRIFEEICAIPHGSGNTGMLSAWCMQFAKTHALKCVCDAVGNVTIVGEATPGYEAAPTIILQGHLDMVCEKAHGCTKDMATEGLDLAVDGDSVYAHGTTLGGDDGIAVAMALAILAADDIPHPRLEVVLTTDEEIGMLGAVAMDMSHLKGRKLINIDSEDEGIFTVSCAGGNVTRCVLPVARQRAEGTVLSVTVNGLAGGHSGVEIDKGRLNANQALGRVLWEISKAADMRLIAVDGGLKDNAIPTEATALLAAKDMDAVRKIVQETQAALQNEYRVNDPGVCVEVTERAADLLPMDKAATDKVICMLCCLPGGIQMMSADISGLVQTSLNLGILTTGEDAVTASLCVRSSVATQKEQLKGKIASLMAQIGGETSYFGEYPGWEYKPDSPLRELMGEVFREQYGRDPEIAAIHAGVECGMFADKLPGLDCVSIGPDLTEIHTPRERMSISSVQRVWRFLLEVLKRAK